MRYTVSATEYITDKRSPAAYACRLVTVSCSLRTLEPSPYLLSLATTAIYKSVGLSWPCVTETPPINHSDPEVMLTTVAFALSAELWLHNWETHKGSKHMELVKSDTNAAVAITQITCTGRHQTRVQAEYVIAYTKRFKASFFRSGDHVKFLK